jgi:acyl-CoA dehydrogenase
VLKRFETEGRPEADRPIVEFLMQKGFNRLGVALAGVLDNLPARWAAMAVRVAAFPFGIPMPAPADELTSEVAEILMRPSTQRDRLTPDLYLGAGRKDHPVRHLEEALALVIDVAPLEKRMREAGQATAQAARDAGIIDEAEFARLLAARDAVRRVIEVDALPMAEVSPIASQHERRGGVEIEGVERSEAAE